MNKKKEKDIQNISRIAIKKTQKTGQIITVHTATRILYLAVGQPNGIVRFNLNKKINL